MKKEIIYSGIIIIIGIALGVAGTLAAVEYNNRLFNRTTGIFSTLNYLDDVGDIEGMEIHIIFGGESGYWVLFQDAPGWPHHPILVKADIIGDHLIRFKIPDNDGKPVNYIGRITKDNLELLSKAVEHNGYILSRTNSYWQ